jgi:hypothetical protein
LPAATRASAAFDAVVDGVAHHVRQRVADLFDDGLVELSIGAGDHQFDVLAEITRNIAHDAVEAVEGLADLHHP